MVCEQYEPRDFLHTDKTAFALRDHLQEKFVYCRPSKGLDRDRTKRKKPTYGDLKGWGVIAIDFKSPLFIISEQMPTPITIPAPYDPPCYPDSSTLNEVKFGGRSSTTWSLP